jgi:alkyl hydroperoxide reductase subunit AhpF
MINYTWNCRTVDVYPVNQENNNVIYNVHYRVVGEDSETAVIADFIGTQVLDTSKVTDFIPFEDLTNDKVTEWVKSAMGADSVSKIENVIASQIAEKENPTSVTMKIED